MRGELFIGLCACAIGIALLVVTFVVPPTPRVVVVPTVIAVETPSMPLLEGSGGGHPVEP